MTLALGVLTVVNIALACFGVSMAIMSPMMFDRGGEHETLLWGVFWSVWAFPALAVVCVVVPWLLLWLRLRRTALVTSAVPGVYLAILIAVLFIFF